MRLSSIHIYNKHYFHFSILVLFIHYYLIFNAYYINLYLLMSFPVYVLFEFQKENYKSL